MTSCRFWLNLRNRVFGKNIASKPVISVKIRFIRSQMPRRLETATTQTKPASAGWEIHIS
ncbi:hypothetical protein [Microcoleus sp.]|uniref:hypothetical protein n=1 Tax=Microcoleus sp. TaxID=44472 RepID=UPI00359422C1